MLNEVSDSELFQMMILAMAMGDLAQDDFNHCMAILARTAQEAKEAGDGDVESILCAAYSFVVEANPRQTARMRSDGTTKL